jgi:hypothetical protein
MLWKNNDGNWKKMQIGDNKIKPNAKGSAFLIET